MVKSLYPINMTINVMEFGLFNDFFQLFFFQGLIFVQHTSLITLKNKNLNLIRISNIKLYMQYRLRVVYTPSLFG